MKKFINNAIFVTDFTGIRALCIGLQTGKKTGAKEWSDEIPPGGTEKQVET
jgi:hypothetical protein